MAAWCAAAPIHTASASSATREPRLDQRCLVRLGHLRAAGGSEQRGLEFCGDCPLKLPLKRDETATASSVDAGPSPSRRMSSSAPRPATSPATRRAARRKPASRARVRPACSTSISSRRVIDEVGADAGAHRLLQLRRGVPAQARRRDVRVHQGALPAHLSLHEHQRPRRSPKRRRGGWCTRASTR